MNESEDSLHASESLVQHENEASNQSARDAAAQALNLNIKLQQALREELDRVNEILAENREALNMALDRICSRTPTIATTSDKFLWCRAMEKFIECNAHPAVNPSRKEQEMLLRQEPLIWWPFQTKALQEAIAKHHPAALDPDTALEALDKIDWTAVASTLDEISKMPGRSKRTRTADECRSRWVHHDMPGIVSVVDPWTKEEDLAIIEQVGRHGDRAWVRVAEEVSRATGRRRGLGRTPIACFKRFQAALSQDIVATSRWTEAEDAVLMEAIQACGPRDWLAISRALPHRIPNQCLNRWHHMKTSSSTFVTDADLEEDGASSPEAAGARRAPQGGESEDSTGEDHSPRPGESRHVVFHRGGPWSAIEERRLSLAVRAMMASGELAARGRREGRRGPDGGPDRPAKTKRKRSKHDEIRVVNWREVSRLMKKERSDNQCREKWFESIDPDVNRGPWDPAEDKELLRCVDARTSGEWVAVEEDMYLWARRRGLRRRTDQQCKRRFSILRPEEYQKHLQSEKERRAVEPPRRSGLAAGFTSRTDVTIQDYDVESESGEE